MENFQNQLHEVTVEMKPQKEQPKKPLSYSRMLQMKTFFRRPDSRSTVESEITPKTDETVRSPERVRTPFPVFKQVKELNDRYSQIQPQKVMKQISEKKYQKKQRGNPIICDYLEGLATEKMKKLSHTQPVLPQISDNKKFKTWMTITETQHKEKISKYRKMTTEEQRDEILKLLYYERNAVRYKMEDDRKDNFDFELYIRGVGGDLTLATMENMWTDVFQARRLLGLRKVEQQLLLRHKLKRQEFDLKLRKRFYRYKLKKLKNQHLEALPPRSQSVMLKKNYKSPDEILPKRAASAMQ